MEEFYPLLRQYNQSIIIPNLPEWTKIFTEPSPPAYWPVLAGLLSSYPKEYSIFEIGSGMGDVLALIKSLGFCNVSGIEKDECLVRLANKKLAHLFRQHDAVIHGLYPINIKKPNILLQVNCVYFDGITTKHGYLKQLKQFYQNAGPDVYLVEVIDVSFKEESKSFPKYVRISEEDMQIAFYGRTVKSYLTYQFPKNTSTKRLYLIE